MPELFERYTWVLIAIFAIPLFIAIGFLLDGRTRDPVPIQITEPTSGSTDIRVYIAGAVQNPGVYPLDDGDRWIDALAAAGGALAEADLSRVNLAKRANDEDQIVVPRFGEASTSVVTDVALVNINVASQTELEALNGIGQARARAIIQSRTTDGPFGTIDDLLTRELLPQSVFEDISGQITVGQ